MTSTPTYRETQTLVANAIAELPRSFGLRAFPGRSFFISRTSSYWSETQGAILLVIVGKDELGNRRDFGKGTLSEIRAQITTIKEEQ
jgi:hypothetical protein